MFTEPVEALPTLLATYYLTMSTWGNHTYDSDQDCIFATNTWVEYGRDIANHKESLSGVVCPYEPHLPLFDPEAGVFYSKVTEGCQMVACIPMSFLDEPGRSAETW